MKTARIQLKNDFTPYPEYKDSGIEWVGKIPKEWDLLKFKSLFSASDERVEDDRSVEQILSVSGYRGIEKKNIKSMDGQMPSEDISAYRIVRPGQLVVNTMWLNYTGLGVSDFTGYVSPAYRSYNIANLMDPKFVHYLLRSILYVQKYSSLLYGIRPNSLQVKPADFEKIEIVMPPLETQKKIAEYLDEKTVLIDQIIEKKKKLIELLREKRTAVINNAMMNSDGELGKIKYYVSINPSKKAVAMTDQTSVVSFVPMEALSETGHLIAQERKYEDVKEGFTYFESGDVVLAKITPCYENGKAGVMRGLKNNFGFGTTEFMVLRANKKIVSEYLYFLIFSDKFRKSGEVEMRGTAGQKRVSNSFVKNYEFRLPDLENQRGIVKELERRTELIDSTFRLIENSIEVLKEFKSSLISHVVTGKIKV